MRREREARGLPGGPARRQRGVITEVLDTIFRQRKLLLVLFTILGVGLAAYLALAPRNYEAEMDILVKARRAELTLSPGVNQDKTLTATFEGIFATEVQMLTSQDLLRSVVAKCGLQTGADSPQDAVRRLDGALRVAPVLKSNLIHVSYTDTDAARAAKVLQTLADLYMEKYIEVHRAPGSLEFFEKQAADAQSVLTAAQARLTEFQSESNIVALAEQKDLMLKKVMELESSLRDAQAQAKENDHRMETLKTQMARATPRITTQRRQMPNQYSVERLNTLLVELRNRRTEAATKFRSEDRLVKQLDQQIADTQAALEAARGTVATEDVTDVNPLRQSLEAELSKAQSLASGLRGRTVALVLQLNELRVGLARLELATPGDQELVRAAKLAEENYLLYAKKREEARIADEMDRKQMINVQLVHPPLVPAQPNGRLRPALVGAALLGTLGILMLAFVVGNRRHALETPWDVDETTDLPLVATVPLESTKSDAGGGGAPGKTGSNQ